MGNAQARERAICCKQRSTERGSAERSPSKPHAEVSASLSHRGLSIRAKPGNLYIIRTGITVA
jgi:hypothetical protein